MCTLAVYRGVSEAFPLIVAANRDEFLARPSAPPARLTADPAIVAGRDLQAGGTWLGARVDGSGRVAGILNRRPSPEHAASGPGELSRGALCIEALATRSTEAIRNLPADRARRYGGFSLFVGDLQHAFVVDNRDAHVHVTELDAGLSVLTNLDVNDPRCPRLAAASQRFSALTADVVAAAAPQTLLEPFAAVLGNHDGEDGPAGPGIFGRVCVHAGAYGTRSSSIIFVGRGGSVRYFHADGPPCTVRFEEVDLASSGNVQH